MHKTSFNPKVIYNLLLVKLSTDIVEYLQTFQQVIVFFFNRFWEISFYSKFSCLKKANTAISNFCVTHKTVT